MRKHENVHFVSIPAKVTFKSKVNGHQFGQYKQNPGEQETIKINLQDDRVALRESETHPS